MSSVSGLSAPHRIRARDLAVQAAYLGLRHAPEVHYSQGPHRFDGILRGLKAYRGEFPTQTDCSAFVTWCIWNGLSHYGVRDTVNGANWRYGWTGTMVDHGKPVVHRGNVLRADAVIYGGGPGEHTAIVVGKRSSDGKIMVISHGSEGGPYFLPYDYRSDVASIRRYI